MRHLKRFLLQRRVFRLKFLRGAPPVFDLRAHARFNGLELAAPGLVLGEHGLGISNALVL